MIPVDVVPRVSAGRLVIGIWIGQSWPQQDYVTTILLSRDCSCPVHLFTHNLLVLWLSQLIMGLVSSTTSLFPINFKGEICAPLESRNKWFDDTFWQMMCGNKTYKFSGRKNTCQDVGCCNWPCHLQFGLITQLHVLLPCQGTPLILRCANITLQCSAAEIVYS